MDSFPQLNPTWHMPGWWFCKRILLWLICRMSLVQPLTRLMFSSFQISTRCPPSEPGSRHGERCPPGLHSTDMPSRPLSCYLVTVFAIFPFCGPETDPGRQSHRCSTFYHCTELLVGLKVSKMSGESGRGHRKMVLRREESESKGFTRQALLCSRFLSSVVSAEQRWWTPEFQEFAFVFCFVLLSLVASLITGQLQHL